MELNESLLKQEKDEDAFEILDFVKELDDSFDAN